MADNQSQGDVDSQGEDAETAEPSAEDQAKAKKAEHDKILTEAKAFFKLSEEAFGDVRREALDDLEFRSGKQWPDKIRADREFDGRPCLVINRLPQHIQQITNDQRQNRPSIKVHPVDDKADVETAKVQQGMIRHIEYNSNADVAYDTAFESTANGGFGFWRVVTDYVSPDSFDQEILIKRIRNPFSVFFDPHSREPDGSDARRAGVAEFISVDDYKALYPNSSLKEMIETNSVGNNAPGWMREDNTVRIAEYFYTEFKEVDLLLLSNGESIEKSQQQQYLEKIAAQLPPGSVMPEIQINKERKARIPVIKWCKLNGVEILEETEWPGKYIPIVPVYGNELDIDGKLILEGVVRNAKDPQRMYNYWKSAETEAIALAPRAPFIAEEHQLEGYEKDWAAANRKNYAFLKYKAFSKDGTPLPPPQRNAFEPAVGAITQAAMLAADDLKATTGIYDAALGAKSNETSGIAIQRRNTQAQTSNFHFIDNLTRSLRHTGRILVDLLPKIYDTARAARIVGDDGEQRIVQVNQPFEENGKQVLYALDSGKYDVTVDVGPSFATKRQEAVASILEFVKAWPQAAPVIGDLLAKNMDWAGSAEIAERLKKMLPPGIADDPKNKGQQLPPEAQAKMQEQAQMIEQLTAKLHESRDTIETKREELESRERIEFKKLEVQLEIERAKIDQKDALALFDAELASIKHRLDLVRSDQPIEQDSQELPPRPDGGMPADPGQAQPQPTGGSSPGQSMEGPQQP